MALAAAEFDNFVNFGSSRVFMMNVDTRSAMLSSDVSSSGCPFRTAGETVRTEN